MKKYILDMKVSENHRLHKNYCLLKLTSDQQLPDMIPGQFVEVRVDNSPTTFLRRPISINYIDKETNELWLLIQLVGDGTKKMAEYRIGDIVNILLPLGNGFTIPKSEQKKEKLLLIGGGVGTAPMLYLGAILKNAGFEPTFLLGARSKDDILQIDQFERFGTVYVTTEDGTLGEKGYVTNHSILTDKHFDRIYTCGPKPMMMAVAKYAASESITCEVSLENTMACGIGACLCCVEKDNQGHHVCVCTEGPVFNINKLTWLS
ncbi:dihydroorotate dehydrogenase electron transfer subunit [Parabacteroides bouchesdurhonensis]|uniref:dihydroorotate dehydrogenase electron transfer subunit n=1 Tax=Parabacteroides bouchesdurhonensis TaxID=1936995 RepID=UPI000E4FE9BE|nr:dihydroorotate dehydrogenase electron transfer subunit [Parabacteroides bouchesdurhonensis]RHJ91424.1 dihydroorotate dehydrogenase electron transfer subunit [Bacteroides sp. AM07-16]